jgi:DNA-binding transcriptional ArsR family regulator
MANTTRRRPSAFPTPSHDLLSLVARRFRVLGDPARLLIVHALEDGELTVSEIVERTGLRQAAVSKHLQQLHAVHFLSRRRDQLYVYYAIADKEVLRLCRMVCGRLASENAAVAALFETR